MFTILDHAVEWRFDKELLRIEAWGKGLRVRATERHEFLPDTLSVLAEQPESTSASVTRDGDDVLITNGGITCRILSNGELKFCKVSGELLLQEYDRTRSMYETKGHFESALEIRARTFSPLQRSDAYRLTLRFEANEGEKLFGMGQYQQPFLDLKGCILELAQRNSQACVPFLLSDRGYGFLWNNPAIGRVVFGKNVTEWTADATKQLDYWIVAGDTPAEIEEAYSAVTGRVPMMPAYGLGFWQCKLRYQTQDEIMEVARRYHREHIPLDVIVVDFFHWPHEGDWDFDRDYWPDPAGMVRELKEMGITLMVSIWPTVDTESVNYARMLEEGGLVRTEYGKRTRILNEACVVDVTSPAAKRIMWETIKRNYYEKGIRLFWLDEAEPELTGYEFEHYRYHIGPDAQVGNLYPREYARFIYEGMQREGQENIVNLIRCAYAGSQRYGTLVWSGDIDSSFQSLRNQLRAGLNIGLAGIPWWTTDIGGFHGGDIRSDSFKELFVRWFEFACFCPVMRLHGFRSPFKEPLSDHGGGKQLSGAENEIWSYGEDIFKICKRYIFLREGLRPYTERLMRETHEKGTPVIRPLFYDFPEDEQAWETDDAYMFGPSLLIAPILYEKDRERRVYLPKGEWTDAFTGERYPGGKYHTVLAPIDRIPVFIKDRADPVLAEAFRKNAAD